jgi:hypothetical protein
MSKVIAWFAGLAALFIALSPLLEAHGKGGGGGVRPAGTPGPAVRPTTPGTSVPPRSGTPPTAKTVSGKTATGKTFSGKSGKIAAPGSYAALHGTKFSRGYFYAGPFHRQWTLRFFSPIWRIWLLYDPSTDQWYYWSPLYNAYLPLNYLWVRPPVANGPGVTPAEAEKKVPVNTNKVPTANNTQAPNVPTPEEVANNNKKLDAAKKAGKDKSKQSE